MARCNICRRDRSGLAAAYPDTPPICKGCYSQLDQAIGFLEMSGLVLLDPRTGQTYPQLNLDAELSRLGKALVERLERQSDTPPTPPLSQEDEDRVNQAVQEISDLQTKSNSRRAHK